MNTHEQDHRSWKYRLTHPTWWVYMMLIPLVYFLYWLIVISGLSR
ncbi:hypothetical protein SAMN00120144_4363 [Hymenobacter roseosalivarius DSM 11622]|uniref:Uncharacterized protein n=1 Tax=Hymenobacter roseosalivarius DSM 11622 TaxID=645990 RepID=A0A1W1UE51_9BACT|nr:hypothetical protein [Hymenobacter roseosalivarius]SMB79064.1 hypothetical protein SAMN00120144_4363 [Hymenobacter roseosalivarius DSM 11622]